MSRCYIVGDVHGCIEELGELVEKLNPEPGDKFYMLGDIVDKGPKSIEALRYVRNLLLRYPGSVCIAGNHEEKALRLYWKSLNDKDAFGRASPHWRKLEPWVEEAGAEDWKFIESMPLLYKAGIPLETTPVDTGQGVVDVTFKQLRLIFVHGGFYPKFFVDYPEGIGENLDGAPVRADWHKGGGKKMDRTRRFLRVRTVSPDGEQVTLGEETPESKQWADVYDGREGFAFYGHEPFPEPRLSKYALGLDTGCVFGGQLTAAILFASPSGAQRVLAGEIEFLAVKAKKQYCAARGE